MSSIGYHSLLSVLPTFTAVMTVYVGLLCWTCSADSVLHLRFIEYMSTGNGSHAWLAHPGTNASSTVKNAIFLLDVRRVIGTRPQGLLSYNQSTASSYTPETVPPGSDGGNLRIKFGDRFGDLPNPVDIYVNDTKHWVPLVRVRALSVPAANGGGQAPSHVAELFSLIAVEQSHGSVIRQEVNLSSVDGMHRLKLSAWLTCQPNSYGYLCHHKCYEQNSSALGHYTCNSMTGEKVCRPGWQDPNTNCTIRQTSSAISTTASPGPELNIAQNASNTTKMNFAQAGDSNMMKTPLIIVIVSMSMGLLLVAAVGFAGMLSRASDASEAKNIYSGQPHIGRYSEASMRYTRNKH